MLPHPVKYNPPHSDIQLLSVCWSHSLQRNSQLAALVLHRWSLQAEKNTFFQKNGGLSFIIGRKLKVMGFEKTIETSRLCFMYQSHKPEWMSYERKRKCWNQNDITEKYLTKNVVILLNFILDVLSLHIGQNTDYPEPDPIWFWSISKHLLSWFLKLDQEHFLPYHFHFISHCHSIICCCIFWVTGRIVKWTAKQVWASKFCCKVLADIVGTEDDEHKLMKLPEIFSGGWVTRDSGLCK